MEYSNGLRSLKSIRYSLPFPLMGCLPNEFLYRYEIWTVENRLIFPVLTNNINMYCLEGSSRAGPPNPEMQSEENN